MIDQLEKEIHEGMLDLYQHQSMSRERESLVYFYFAGIHNENITLKEEVERLKEENKELEEIIGIRECQLEEMQQQKTDYKQVNILEMKIDKLHSIIKEVREYIEEKNKYNSKPPFLMSGETKKLLEILDKENI